jgi:hypothetical protein
MRLLNISTLVVEEFLSQTVPEYVILSHTWEQEEVTLQDMISGCAPKKKGWAKISGCCKKALADGFSYCWIDTCCIDKTSSAELSEAINSMYKWYEGSCICYVYLSDVTEESKNLSCNSDGAKKSFALTRWFKRGWTLQELIAPVVVEFYNAEWEFIGTKRSLRDLIEEITGIDGRVLRGDSPRSCNLATRMTWASHRETTRVEDESYCLLGIFGVNVPLLYGEGQRAFRRLQEGILKIEEDYTLFLWSPIASPDLTNHGLLAHNPSCFRDLQIQNSRLSIVPPQHRQIPFSKNSFSRFQESSDHLPPHITSRGLRISMPLMPDDTDKRGCWACITLLSSQMLCIHLHKLERTKDSYSNDTFLYLKLFPPSYAVRFKRKLIYVVQPNDQTSS